MEGFRDFTGLVAPLLRNNVDTDQIIPKQFLTSLTKTGYGLFLFNSLRWEEPAKDATVTRAQLAPRRDFILNEPRYAGAKILLTGDNFGCGSSREHAVWALKDYGFKVVISASFADIFFSNSSKNNLLLVKLAPKDVAALTKECLAKPGFELQVCLSAAKPYVATPSKRYPFAIDPGLKRNLIEGRDEIAITEQYGDKIKEYERRRLEQEPWLDPQGANKSS